MDFKRFIFFPMGKKAFSTSVRERASAQPELLNNHYSLQELNYKFSKKIILPYITGWSMIMWVSVIHRGIVCDDIDWCFDNLSGSHHQSWLPRFLKHQSMSSQTVPLRITLTQMIILNQLMMRLPRSIHLQCCINFTIVKVILSQQDVLL